MSESRVTLVFKTREERDWFMGQLSDGFGENECDLSWRGDDLDRAKVVRVTPQGDLWDHHLTMLGKYPRTVRCERCGVPVFATTEPGDHMADCPVFTTP